MTPAALALAGLFDLPSSSSGAAAMAPSFHDRRVVPPAPGKMPTLISGRPICARGLSAAKMRWHDNGSSRPMPIAVPGRAAAIGLPPFCVLRSMPASSIFLSSACIAMMPSNRPCAGLSPALSRMSASTFRSMPPAKSALPEVMTTPLTAASASALSTQASNSRRPSKDMTFMDFPGTSQVMVATPSASRA